MLNLIHTIVLGASLLSLTACSSALKPEPVVVVAAAAPAPAPPETIRWERIGKIMDLAEKQDKMAFVVFTQDDCEPCQKLLTETLTHPLVVKVIKNHYVAAHVKNDMAAMLLTKLGLPLEVPTILVMSPKTGFSAKSVGLISPKDLGSSLMSCVALSKIHVPQNNEESNK